MTEHILGIILAGGQARRMGGGDKGRLDLGGQSLIGEVITRLRPQCAALVLNANGDAGRFADLGLPVVGDSIAGYPGPLAGLLAGMDEAVAAGFTHVLTAAADTPFLPMDMAARLREAIRIEAQPIALCATLAEGRVIRQPTFGLWPVALREDLRQALHEGVSKVVVWAGRHGIALATFDTRTHDPFFNVNTPDELESARRIWQSISAN